MLKMYTECMNWESISNTRRRICSTKIHWYDKVDDANVACQLYMNMLMNACDALLDDHPKSMSIASIHSTRMYMGVFCAHRILKPHVKNM